MDLFHGARVVRLLSHLDKFLIAKDDLDNVCQDRRGDSYGARWTVELVEGSPSLIRLKSCYGRYLTASNKSFFLGVAGRKVLQTAAIRLDSSVEWEPIREGSRVMLKTHDGRFLRANGGLPPLRNSVTHNTPRYSITHTWLLWNVITLSRPSTAPSSDPSLEAFRAYLSTLPSYQSEVTCTLLNIIDPSLQSDRASLSSLPSDVPEASLRLPDIKDPSLQSDRAFPSSLPSDVPEVSLRLPDIEDPSLQSDRASPSSLPPDVPEVSLRLPDIEDPSLQSDRASSSSLPPDVPEVSLRLPDIKNACLTLPSPSTSSFIMSDPPLQPDIASLSFLPSDVPEVSPKLFDIETVSLTLPSSSTSPFIKSNSPSQPDRASLLSSPSNVSEVSSRLSDNESRSSSSGPIHQVPGWTIHYTVADDDGNLDESFEGSSIIFNEHSIKELTRRLEVETNLSDIIVCGANRVNGRLRPLFLPLPPSNEAMHVVVVRASSRGESLR